MQSQTVKPEKTSNFLEKEKTGVITIRNISSNYIIKVGMVTAFDDGDIEEGMNKTTGPVVLASELKPGETQRADLGPLNVRADRLQFSFIWRWIKTGEEKDAHWPDVKASQGGYIKTHEYIIRNADVGNLIDDETPPDPELQ